MSNSESKPDDQHEFERKQKRRCLMWSIACSATNGFLMPLVSQGTYELVSYCVLGFLMLMYAAWLRFDIRQHAYPIGRYGFLTMIALGTAFMPWYLTKTRGKRVVVTFAKMIGFYLLLIVIGMVCALVAEGILVVFPPQPNFRI